MTFRIDRWLDYLQAGMLGGVVVTLQMWLLVCAVAIVFALPVAAMRSSRWLPIRLIATTYIELFRATPLLVQLLAFYAGLPLLGIMLSPWTTAVLVIVLNSGSFLAEAYRAGFNAVPRGQREAAQALGMGVWQEQVRVVLPQAFRVIQPAVGTTLVNALLCIPFVYLVGVPDLMAWTTKIAQFQGDLSVYLLATLLYVFMALVLSRGNAALERRLKIP